jgi:MFS transporter, ACS family, tartrate transporter
MSIAMASDLLERSLIRKISLRCMPIVILGFVISYVDRINVGFAAITANKDLGLTASMYGAGAGLLFIGYSVFELPSNLALERYGARLWLARIMISWGVISGCMVFVTGPTSFYLVRFLLGAAEAGFFPGVLLYLTYWYPRRYRARYVGLFSIGIPLASVVGAPISGLLLTMHGLLGIKGWQWLYLMEALPAILLGIAMLVFLADRPMKASWLSMDEKIWLEDELARERAEHREQLHIPPLSMLLDTRVLMLALVFFLTGVPSYGVSLWLPQIVKSFGLGFVQTGFVSAIPFLFGCIAVVAWAKSSDRTHERVWHSVSAAVVAFIGLAIGAYLASPVLQMVALSVSALGIFGLKGPWLALISETFATPTAAAGIALVSTLGSLSGFAAPYMVGVIIDQTGSYRLGLLALGLQSLLGGIVLLAWTKGSGRRYYERRAWAGTLE